MPSYLASQMLGLGGMPVHVIIEPRNDLILLMAFFVGLGSYLCLLRRLV
jgi:hypothetical protein